MSDLDQVCIQLMELQVRRKFFIGLNNKQTNAAKALVRRQLGWNMDADEGTREKVNARASRIVSVALSGKEPKDEDQHIFDACSNDLTVLKAALAPCENERHKIELLMCRIIRKTAIHEWQKSVPGFGEKALAVIVGECGNLSNYPSDEKLYKRLGLAPFNGKAFSTWRRDGGLTKDDWIRSGYAPKRRAEIHSVMEPLFRWQGEQHIKETGEVRPALEPYGGTYYRRRARTEVTHPDWRPIQRHMDALRIMTQRLISDLWSEWRKAVSALPEMAEVDVPSATELKAA